MYRPTTTRTRETKTSPPARISTGSATSTMAVVTSRSAFFRQFEHVVRDGASLPRANPGPAVPHARPGSGFPAARQHVHGRRDALERELLAVLAARGRIGEPAVVGGSLTGWPRRPGPPRRWGTRARRRRTA